MSILPGSLLLLGLLHAAPAIAAPGPARSRLARDERVAFLPALASRIPAGGFRVEVEGWVHEPEEGSRARALAVRLVRETLRLGEDDAAIDLAEARLRPFLADNERGKRIVIRIGQRLAALGPSAKDGRFAGSVEVSGADAGGARRDFAASVPWLELQAVLADGDERSFSGRVWLLEPDGVSVVSDIDDTIRIARVHDRRALLESTFARPYVAVPGMADRYRRWAESGAALHYVSNSPRPLLEPILGFLAEAGFPAGSLALGRFRWKDRSLLDLLEGSEGHKESAIADLLERYPGRRFVLVGDTGERDPEIYARMAERHRPQIALILLRQAGGAEDLDGRLARTFAGLPRELWRVFRNGEDLAGLDLPQ